MKKYIGGCSALCVMLPLIASAQVARNGNESDFRDHQPTQAVQSQERSAGVAPNAAEIQAQNRDLRDMNSSLQQRAQHDAQTVPTAVGNVYGVQPGGIVHITPKASAGGGGGGSP